MNVYAGRVSKNTRHSADCTRLGNWRDRMALPVHPHDRVIVHYCGEYMINLTCMHTFTFRRVYACMCLHVGLINGLNLWPIQPVSCSFTHTHTNTRESWNANTFPLIAPHVLSRCLYTWQAHTVCSCCVSHKHTGIRNICISRIQHVLAVVGQSVYSIQWDICCLYMALLVVYTHYLCLYKADLVLCISQLVAW